MLFSTLMKNNNTSLLQEIPFTYKQELANTIIHALGLVAGFIGVPVLINAAIRNNDANSIIGACIYGTCFLILFAFSTLYHSCRHTRRKCFFERLDYISIYFLIAGTYTPFVLIYMPNASGFSLLCMVWACAIAGALFKMFSVNLPSVTSVCLYVFTGLLFLIKCKSFFEAMPYHVGALIIVGVVLYLSGIIFFLWQKWYYHHAVWHGFTLVASACHFAAVLLTVNV